MTETAVLTLAEFLLARIAEDEAKAYGCPSGRGEFTIGGRSADDLAAFIRHNNPARVLAECEAKRQIVGVHGPAMAYCSSGVWEDTTHAEIDEPCETLRLLALPHADHPDYRDEWRLSEVEAR